MTFSKATGRTIFLVACVKEKLPHAAPARELYRSTWFTKARSYVESQGDAWFILSAKHGVVEPDRRIDPYDCTLLAMPSAQRRVWADNVAEQLSAIVAPGDEVVFLAGARYRDKLISALEGRGVIVRVPMQGLGIGQQLHWLGRKAAECTE